MARTGLFGGRAAARPVVIEEPPLAKWLFGSSAAAWIWLIARIWLGWIRSGTVEGHHLQIGDSAAGFAKGALATGTRGRAP
jgi:hypothetical protein